MYGCAGCNLFTQTPLIRDWLVDLYPGKPFTVGSYAYLNGALHVQVSLAMDAICRDLCERRTGTSLAYLCTPTDLHLIPKDAHDAAKANYKIFSKKPFCVLMKLLGGKKFLRKNVCDPVSGVGGEFYYVNGISVAQGPNYGMCSSFRQIFTTPCRFITDVALFLQPWLNVCSTGERSLLAEGATSFRQTLPHRRRPCPLFKTERSHGHTRACLTSSRTRSSRRRRPKVL